MAVVGAIAAGKQNELHELGRPIAGSRFWPAFVTDLILERYGGGHLKL